MNVSPSEAQEALAAIQAMVQKTRRFISSSGAYAFFIIWGAVWLVGFLADALTGIMEDTTQGLSATASNALLMPPIEASPSLSASIAVQNVGAMGFSLFARQLTIR